MATIFKNAADAINEANFLASRFGRARVIGYVQGKGWTHYDPTFNAPDNAIPEMLCFALGKIPMPLSDEGIDVLNSVIRSELLKRR